MYNRSFSLVTYAGIFLLAVACSGDNPAGPGAPGQVNPNAPVSNAINSDIAATAGNAIASNLEELVANQVAAVGSFAVFAPSRGSFGGDSPASSPSSPAPDSGSADSASSTPPQQPNCVAGNEPGVFLCQHQPGPGDHLQCTYSEQKKLYICVKQESSDSNPPASDPQHPDSNPPASEPQQPAPAVTESCSFDAASLIYSCVRVGDSKRVVKSYQFLDASGKPMEKFVKGVTEAIHFLVKSDGSDSGDNFSGVSHSQRDVVESGFLGPNRVYNGFGFSADTSSHKEDLVTRKYSGVAVDTLKAVTFVDQRNEHPYPLSGVAIRVVDYTVVSSGTQLETTTVHKRLVVTFNGTADVPISLGDYSCVLHLDTHKVDGCK